MDEKKEIRMAVTLTTGIIAHRLGVDKVYNILIKMLNRKKKYFNDFFFVLEFLNRNLIETKVHYHGYICVEKEHIRKYNEFIGEWRDNIGMVKCEDINDFEGWKNYCLKYIEITELSYKELFDIKQIIIDKDGLPTVRDKIKLDSWFNQREYLKKIS